MKLNKTTTNLPPYPMEELAKIKRKLAKMEKAIFDFGTGDPRIPTWEPIRNAVANALPEISSYPSIRGRDELLDAQRGYLERRFGLDPQGGYAIAPTRGSKEAVFHTALCLVGRAGGKKHIIYPDPGYPVYKSSAQFAGGTPYPVRLQPEKGYLMLPWNLPKYIQKDAAAIWVNYPHNPTGAVANKHYWEKLVDWARSTDTILLSDDCYVDIYDTNLDVRLAENPDDDDRPTTPLTIATEGVLSFQSLSKRSGLTGYRSGFMAGDPELITGLLKARANFGLAQPEFIQEGSIVAWNDDDHVTERRKIFTERVQTVAPVFQELGMLDEAPSATFYLWCRLPEGFKGDDTKFALALAKEGVICSPSQWLSEGMKGFVRFALVPGRPETEEAMEIIRGFVAGLSEDQETDEDSDELPDT